MADPDVPTVSYPISRLLDRLQEGIDGLAKDMASRLDRIEQALAAKADKADLAAVSNRVAVLETADAERKTAATIAREHAAAKTDWRRWAWPVLISVALVIVSILQLFVR